MYGVIFLVEKLYYCFMINRVVTKKLIVSRRRYIGRWANFLRIFFPFLINSNSRNFRNNDRLELILVQNMCNFLYIA